MAQPCRSALRTCGTILCDTIRVDQVSQYLQEMLICTLALTEACMPAIRIQSLLFLVKIQILSAVEGKTVPGAPFETPRCPTGAYACSDPQYFPRKEKLEQVRVVFNEIDQYISQCSVVPLTSQELLGNGPKEAVSISLNDMKLSVLNLQSLLYSIIVLRSGWWWNNISRFKCDIPQLRCGKE